MHTLKCDCEIARASLLVHFEGDCENEQGNSVELNKYKCGSDLGVKEFEDACLAMPEFDCLEQSGADDANKATTGQDTFKQGVDLKPTDVKHKPSESQNNINTKLPNKEAGSNHKIESGAASTVTISGVCLVFALVARALF